MGEGRALGKEGMFEKRPTRILTPPANLTLLKYHKRKRASANQHRVTYTLGSASLTFLDGKDNPSTSALPMSAQEPVTLQPTSLRVETTFPAVPDHPLDYLSQLSHAQCIRLDEAQLPSFSSPSGIWDVRFHSGSGEGVIWRWVDWEPFSGLCCCGGAAEASRFRGELVAGGGGEIVRARESRRCWPREQGSSLLVRDGDGVELGSVRQVRERYFLVLGVSGSPMMEIVEEEAGTLSPNRVYTFLWASEGTGMSLSRRKTFDVNPSTNSAVLAKGTRKVKSRGILLSQGLCGLQFQQTSVPLDPLHKLLCLAAMLYIQKLTFRRYLWG